MTKRAGRGSDGAGGICVVGDHVGGEETSFGVNARIVKVIEVTM